MKIFELKFLKNISLALALGAVSACNNSLESGNGMQPSGFPGDEGKKSINKPVLDSGDESDEELKKALAASRISYEYEKNFNEDFEKKALEASRISYEYDKNFNEDFERILKLSNNETGAPKVIEEEKITDAEFSELNIDPITYNLPKLSTGRTHIFALHGLGMDDVWMREMCSKGLEGLGDGFVIHYLKNRAGKKSFELPIDEQVNESILETFECLGDDVDANKIFIGHSQGAIVAALLAKGGMFDNVKALISVTGPLEGAQILNLRKNPLVVFGLNLYLASAKKDPNTELLNACVSGKSQGVLDLEPGSKAMNEVSDALKKENDVSVLAVGIESSNPASFVGLLLDSNTYNGFICGASVKKSDGLIDLSSQIGANILGKKNFSGVAVKGNITHRDLNHPFIWEKVITHLQGLGLIKK